MGAPQFGMRSSSPGPLFRFGFQSQRCRWSVPIQGEVLQPGPWSGWAWLRALAFGRVPLQGDVLKPLPVCCDSRFQFVHGLPKSGVRSSSPGPSGGGFRSGRRPLAPPQFRVRSSSSDPPPPIRTRFRVCPSLPQFRARSSSSGPSRGGLPAGRWFLGPPQFRARSSSTGIFIGGAVPTHVLVSHNSG